MSEGSKLQADALAWRAPKGTLAASLTLNIISGLGRTLLFDDHDSLRLKLVACGKAQGPWC